MNTVLNITLAALFTFLSLLHFYWAFGGKALSADVFPQKSNSDKEKLFQPPVFLTILVALGLAFFASISFSYLIETKLAFHFAYERELTWLIVIIFSLRALGDFKYLGLFRQIRETGFAKKDRKYYTPLCLFIACSKLIIFL